MTAIFRNGLRALLMISFLAGVASGRQPVQPKPLWRVDLRKLGFAYPSGFQFSLTAHTHHTIVNFSGNSIAVTHNGYIAFAFLTTEIDGKASDPSKLTRQHLISLVAATGRVVSNREWPAENADESNAYVGATAEGNFVFLKRKPLGEALCLFSPDLHGIQRKSLPADPANSSSGWSIFVPTDGSSIFIQYYLNGKRSLQMLDANTLRENGAWSISEDIRQFSGRYVWQLREDPAGGVSLYTRTFTSPWRATARLGHCADKNIEFSNEDTAVVNCGDSVTVIHADGRVLFTVRAPRRRRFSSAWGSPDGRFVAAATTTKHGLAMAEAFDMSSGRAPRRLLVYDTKTGKVVESLKFTWGYELAFFHDSSGFVLLSGGILEMFKLPKPAR